MNTQSFSTSPSCVGLGADAKMESKYLYKTIATIDCCATHEFQEQHQESRRSCWCRRSIEHPPGLQRVVLWYVPSQRRGRRTRSSPLRCLSAILSDGRLHSKIGRSSRELLLRWAFQVERLASHANSSPFDMYLADLKRRLNLSITHSRRGSAGMILLSEQNGGYPISISYMMTPKLHQSHAGP